MDDKKVLIPVDEKELASIAGGEGEPDAIRVGPSSGGFYTCPSCGYDDFYIIRQDATWVFLRCKRCNAVCKAAQ
ncbi:MAG: hypothetical protein PHC80_01120 [Eubacteriales bacterium]|nr:hypothetical protein [Eubacteriales bacterium]